MAFNQYNLERVHDQSRGGFDLFVYSHDTDTIADITTTGYFNKETFGFKSPGSSPKMIMVSCADGDYQVKYDVASGVVGVVSSPSTGAQSSYTLTVGSGGVFSTINAALDHAKTIGKSHKAGNVTVTVSLLTGFVMAEQVICDGENLSYITITSVDAEVTIQRSALAATGITNLDYDSTPAFLAVNGGTLPTIGALFSMDTSGSADSAKQHGVMAAWGGHVNVAYGCGVRNSTGRGLYLVGATAYARNSVWDNAGTRGIRVGNGSIANVRGASATACGEYGLAMGGASIVTASGLDVSGCLGTGILVDNACQLNADSIDASGCAINGMDVKFGSNVNVYAGNFSNSGVRAVDIVSSLVEMENANCSNAGSTPIVINKGSNVNAQNVTATTTGNTVAVSCTASRLNFKNGTASSTGAQPIRVFDGAEIVAVGSTGGFNVTANTVTASGIVFK